MCLSSVGLERFSDKEKVIGSIPIGTTRKEYYSMINNKTPWFLPTHGKGDIYTVKIFENGAKAWWRETGEISKIRYANGDIILFKENGLVYRVIDHDGHIYKFEE